MVFGAVCVFIAYSPTAELPAWLPPPVMYKSLVF